MKNQHPFHKETIRLKGNQASWPRFDKPVTNTPNSQSKTLVHSRLYIKQAAQPIYCLGKKKEAWFIKAVKTFEELSQIKLYLVLNPCF